MKKIVLLLIFTAFVALNTTVMAAPSAPVLEQTIAGVPSATVIGKELQIVTEMFDGFAKLDHAKFSKDFDANLKNVFTPEVFKSAHKDTTDKLGQFQGMELLLWQAGETAFMDTVIYRGRFAKDQQMAITVVLNSKNPADIKVSKVTFESDLLSGAPQD